MSEITFKFEVGARAYLDGVEVIIEARGKNINWWPVYKVNGCWYREDELQEWIPPCPV